jgi:hypothetical protein
VHKCCKDRDQPKAERCQRDEPSRAHVFAEEVGWDLEDDVADVEY